MSVTFCVTLCAWNIDPETPTLISDYPSSQAPMLTDRINAGEMQGRVMVDRVTEHDRESKVWQRSSSGNFNLSSIS
jgi:hypothetical protein